MISSLHAFTGYTNSDNVNSGAPNQSSITALFFFKRSSFIMFKLGENILTRSVMEMSVMLKSEILFSWCESKPSVQLSTVSGLYDLTHCVQCRTLTHTPVTLTPTDLSRNVFGTVGSWEVRVDCTSAWKEPGHGLRGAPKNLNQTKLYDLWILEDTIHYSSLTFLTFDLNFGWIIFSSHFYKEPVWLITTGRKPLLELPFISFYLLTTNF